MVYFCTSEDKPFRTRTDMKTTAPSLGNERTPSGRMNEIDYLKCVCILLMVVFHLAYIGDKYPYAKLVVYTFHMPVFLLISGYLTHIDRPAGEFLRKYLWIFIPYAVMETGYAVVSSLLPVRQGLEELSLPAVLEALFVSPVGPYWYLHTLMLCALFYYAVFRLVRGQAITRFIILGLCFYGLACLHLLAFENAVYFLGGCVLAQTGIKLNRFFRPSLWAVVPLLLLCAIPDNLSRGSLAGVAVTYFATCLLLYFYPFLTPCLRRGSLYIGRHTLAILLFSPIFTMLAKGYLPLLAFDPTGMLFLTTATALAVGGSLAIEQAIYRLGLSRYFFGK